MATIQFFEKPGCGGNARQRALLVAAGHRLQRHSLLTHHWTAESLTAFLAPLPVAAWFNRAAPRIKSGQIVPEALGAHAAVALLLTEPLLIRRPLMQRDDGARLVGFELAEVAAFVGLGAAASSTGLGGSLEGCAAVPQAGACPSPDDRSPPRSP